MNNNPTLSLERIAYRPPEQHWQWFGPAVHFTARGGFETPQWYIAHSLIESQCEQLVKQYGLGFCMDKDHVRIIKAPTERALELVDLSTL